MFVGEKGYASYLDIEEEFDISNAAASRTLNSLSASARHRQRAVGLVEIIRDPLEGRRYLVKLTEKGKQAYELITLLSSS